MKWTIILVIGLMFLVNNLTAINTSNDRTMADIVEYYLIIQQDLAADKTVNVNNIAAKMSEKIKMLKPDVTNEPEKGHFQGISEELTVQTDLLIKASNIKEMRNIFKELSKPMSRWATQNKPAGINVAYCPMAPGSWLQKGEDIRNPYYGASMLKCGEIVSSGEEITPCNMKDHNCDNCDLDHHGMKHENKSNHHSKDM